MRRAVFLDRDGVLNRTFVREGIPYPPNNVAEVEVLPGVEQALEKLAAHNLLLIVVTNQPDVARGTQTRDVVEMINAHLAANLPINDVVACYHDTPDGCPCRKPQPGMLLEAAARRNIDLGHSFMVGDRWSDIAAGQAAGCVTFLLDVPYNQRQRCTPDYEVIDLRDAAERIVQLLHQ